MHRNRQPLLTLLAAVCFATLLPFVAQISFSSSGYSLDLSCFYCTVPMAVAVLLLSPIMPRTRRLLPRVLLGLWLALFLRAGFDIIFVYAYPVNSWPWTGYFIYGLILGVAFLVFASDTIASLGFIKLTVCAGFVIACGYDVLNFAYGYDWFAIYTRLRIGMWVTPDDSGWPSYFLVWLEYPTWLSYRLLTYLGLGYLLARRKGLVLGIVLSMLVALVDSVIGWLVFLPGDGDFEAPPLWVALQYDLVEWLKALLAQVADLSIIALAGAWVTLVKWSPAFRRTVRLVSASTARRRSRFQIKPGTGQD